MQLSLLSFAGWKRAPAVGGKSRLPCVPFNEASHSLKPNICVPARLGKALILIFVLVFGGWGYFAPLDGGAVAPGVINPDSGKKTIQHFEGGIIAEMRVREGEAVTVGQPLVVLESTQARAAHDSAHAATLVTSSQEGKTGGRKRWAGPDRVASRNALDGSADRKHCRGAAGGLRRAAVDFSTKKNVLAQQIEQLTQQINGNEAQVESASRQIEFVSEELQAKEYLVKRGLVAKPEALRLKRVDAELFGKRGEYLAAIARLRQQIGETKLQILSIDAERADQIANDADKVRADLTDVTEKLQR